jgi:hypothetical protein
MCVGKKNKYYFQWCIYHKDNYNYSPNYNISCHPEERIKIYTSCSTCWKWTDCCANSPEECCIKEFYTFPPTNQPTLSPYSECLLTGCTKEFTMDKCNIFENINNNIACNAGDVIKCCSNNKRQCCIFKTTEVFGTLGLVLIFVCLILLFLLKEKKKIIPELKLNKINPI